MSRMPRFEREKELKRKKHQRYLVNAGGALALGAGAARIPGATKTASRYVKPLARSKGATRLANAAGTWTPRSNALAASGGAVGAASSLNWGRQLKTEVKREEQKLGIAKGSGPTTQKLGIAKASQTETRQRRRSLAAAGVTGVGASTAALGALAGGVPKGKLDPSKPNIKSAWGGGILGYRHAAHKKAQRDIASDVASEKGRWAQSQTEEFMRHRKAGKLGPERAIIGHMRRGQRMGRSALYGGAAVAGVGALGVARNRRRTSYDRPKSPFEVRKKAVSRVDPRDYQGREERSGARTVGGGLGTAAVAGGSAGVLNRQGKKWKAYEQRSLRRAGQLVPGLKGMKEPASGSDWHGVGQRLANQPQDEAGWSKVRAAGRHHGRATQAKYFADTYRRNAKVFGGVAAAGLGTAAYGAYKARRNRPYGRAELRKRSYVEKSEPRYGSMGVVGKRDNDELGRKIGAATNTAGAIAGPAALYGAVKGRKEGGIPRGFTRDFGNSPKAQRKMPKAAARARKVAAYLDSPKSKPARVAAGVAGATAIGLQSANWAGDAIAARTLSKKPTATKKPQPVAKSQTDVAKASAKQRKRKAQRRAHEAQRARANVAARSATVQAARPDPVPDNVKLGGPTTPRPPAAAVRHFNGSPLQQAPKMPRVAQPPLKGSTLSGGRKAALAASGLGAAALVGAGAGRLRRRSKVEKVGEWRQHVSDSAIEAHDKTLPKYRAAKEQDMWANVATGGLGAGMAHRGAKQIMRGRRGSGAVMAGAGTLTALAGASGARRNFRGARDIEERQRKIRARGYQRREASMEKLAKAMLAPPKPPKPVSPGRLKPTAGMKQRSFTRSSTTRTNPSGTMSTVSGTTR